MLFQLDLLNSPHRVMLENMIIKILLYKTNSTLACHMK